MNSTAEHMPSDTPSWALVLSAVLAVVICVVGCLGNLFTILALPYSRKIRNSATWFIVNLALTEIIFCVTILPMSAYHLIHLKYNNTSIFDTNGCKLFVFLRFVIISSELLDIAAIAINRCILIAFPKRYYKIFTKAHTIAIILGIWTFSIVVMFFPLFGVYGSFNYNHYTNECDFSEKSRVPRKVYLVIGFFVPCLLIIISYSYIFYKAQQSSARLRRNAAGGCAVSRPASGLRNRDMRIARVIAVIFLVFIVCCTPVSIGHYYGSQGQFPTLLLLLHPLYWLQYCLNMFLYVLMNKQYREAYISYIIAWWPGFKRVTNRFYKFNEEETSVSDRCSKRKRSLQHLQITPSATPNPTPTTSRKHALHPSDRPKIHDQYAHRKLSKSSTGESNFKEGMDYLEEPIKELGQKKVSITLPDSDDGNLSDDSKIMKKRSTGKSGRHIQNAKGRMTEVRIKFTKKFGNEVSMSEVE